MQIIQLEQGSPEWLAHRAKCFNASDAPAMLGISPYKSRSKLIEEIATGISQEVDAQTRRRFDDGHRFEALARPLAEQILDDDLYPIFANEDKYGLSRPLSASSDGLNMAVTKNFEHKSLNDSLRSIFANNEPLTELYTSQMEQQHMVFGVEETLFMASTFNTENELVEKYERIYKSDAAMRERLIAGWIQLEKDVAEYQRKLGAGEIERQKEKPKAEVTIELPALFVHAKGEITTHNMDEFGTALTARLAEVRAIALVNDQDFSNAKEAAKKFRETAKAIAMSKEQMLAQTETIGEAARKMDAWEKDLNATALQLEKDVEREDKAKKDTIVMSAAADFRAHVEDLEAETRPIQLAVQRPNFAEAIKGKRNYASMQDAVDTMLANAKIGADSVAKDVRAKLAWCKENAAGHSALFPDLQNLMSKPLEDFSLTITSRIDKHKADEAAKMEAVRAQAEADARAKIEAEAKAKEEAAQHHDKTVAYSTAPAGKHMEEVQQSLSSNRAAQPANRPTDDQIIDAIALHFRVDAETAMRWVFDMKYQTMEPACA